MGNEPTLEWEATSSGPGNNPSFGDASGAWTHNWGTITTGSAQSGTLFVRHTVAGAIVTSMSFYVCDDGASTWADPVPKDGWISAGTAATNEQIMSSGSSLDMADDSLEQNQTDSVLMRMEVPGGASGGTQAFDYRIKYTWA